MKKIAIAALAIGALATTFVTPASAAAPSDTDLLCGFSSNTDPNPEAPDDTQTGEIDGGPILQNGTITCTIQVGGGLHSDPNNGASASATGTNGVTFLAPTLVSYTSPSQVPVYLCDQFNDGTTTYYFDDTTGTWTTNAGSACRLAISAGTDDPVFDPIRDLEEALDPTLCAVLALLSPGVPGVLDITSTGDTYVLGEFIWDCPPYELG